MAVIKCSNCENEILDTEIVCPYCDCPLAVTKDKLREASVNHETESAAESHNTMKIASREDFEKEKSALMAKLAEEEKTLNETSGAEMTDKTVKISKDELNRGNKRDTDVIPSKDIKSKAARIRITAPQDDSKPGRASRQSVKPKDKSKKMIVAVTLIGIIIIVYLIVALYSNIQSNMSSLKDKENKKSKVVTSDSEVVDAGFKFTSSSTLVITSDDVMDDFESASMAPWADKANQIKHITIEDSVERISDYAFAHFTVLEDVVLGENVSEIGKEAFYGCTSLERVTCRSDSKLRTIGDNAFTNCTELESFKLGSSIKSIGDGAFKSCSSLDEIEIPANVKIGDDAFLGCSSDFIILCRENSSAHEYADQYGIKVEFTDKDDNEDEENNQPEDTDNSAVNNDQTSDNDSVSDKDDKSTDGDSKKDTGSNKDNKIDKDADTDKDNDSTKNDTSANSNEDKSGTASGESSSSETKSQEEILEQIKENNTRLKDSSISAEEKAALEAERDKLSVQLDELMQ